MYKSGVLHCNACDYRLTGLPQEGAVLRCPECGCEQSMMGLILVKPWPSKAEVCWFLCSWTIMMGALCIGALSVMSAFGPIPLMTTVALAVVCAILQPCMQAWKLCERHVPEAGRRRVHWRLILAAWVLNVVIGAVYLGIGLAIARAYFMSKA